MRGYDQTLTRTVYWQTSQLDALATSYPGPGPVVDVVVQNVIGKSASPG